MLRVCWKICLLQNDFQLLKYVKMNYAFDYVNTAYECIKGGAQ